MYITDDASSTYTSRNGKKKGNQRGDFKEGESSRMNFCSSSSLIIHIALPLGFFDFLIHTRHMLELISQQCDQCLQGQ